MVWYKAGAADEVRRQVGGIAHFLEHLMFKGTSTVGPGMFSRIVAQNGGTRQTLSPREDYTAFHQTVASTARAGDEARSRPHGPGSC